MQCLILQATNGNNQSDILHTKQYKLKMVMNGFVRIKQTQIIFNTLKTYFYIY